MGRFAKSISSMIHLAIGANDKQERREAPHRNSQVLKTPRRTTSPETYPARRSQQRLLKEGKTVPALSAC